MNRAVTFIVASSIILCPRAAHEQPSEKTCAQNIEVFIVSSTINVSPCPDDMVLIDGDYCQNVKETCLEWVDARGIATKEAIPSDGDNGRCGTYKYPTECLSLKVKKRFCIDIYEYPNVKGQRPQSWMTWFDAKIALEKQDKRLCTQSEWAFAAGGHEMRPYPYGDGYHRDRTSCNTDNEYPKGLDVFKATSHDTPAAILLDAMLVQSGEKVDCVSTFGVYDLAGNVDEWVVNENGHPHKSGLMGGHIFGVRNRSRAITVAHGPKFSWYETSVRGCKDAN